MKLIIGKVSCDAKLEITLGKEKVIYTQQELAVLIDELNSQLYKECPTNYIWSNNNKLNELI